MFNRFWDWSMDDDHPRRRWRFSLSLSVATIVISVLGSLLNFNPIFLAIWGGLSVVHIAMALWGISTWDRRKKKKKNDESYIDTTRLEELDFQDDKTTQMEEGLKNAWVKESHDRYIRELFK